MIVTEIFFFKFALHGNARHTLEYVVGQTAHVGSVLQHKRRMLDHIGNGFGTAS